jgi:hypothetical protein
MGFLDKAKAAAEQAVDKTKVAAESAASKAKEGVDDVQTKRHLNNAYEELGRTAYGLVEAGTIAHESLTAGVTEIRELEHHLADQDAAPAEPAAEPAAAPAEPAAIAPEPAPAADTPAV